MKTLHGKVNPPVNQLNLQITSYSLTVSLKIYQFLFIKHRFCTYLEFHFQIHTHLILDKELMLFYSLM